MKFTFFRKLRNQEGAAGSAPASAPAPAAPAAPSTPQAAPAASPSPVAVQGEGGTAAGQEPASAPVPAAFAWPDPSVDFDAWTKAYDSAPDEERDRWARGEVTFDQPAKDGDQPVDPNQPPPPADAGEVDLSQPLSPEEIQNLPPRVKAMLETAQDTLAEVGKYESFLNPEFQQSLTAVLSDPVVQQRIKEMQGGAETSAWLEQAIDAKGIAEQLLESKELDAAALGYDLDPEGVTGNLEKFAKAIMAKMEGAFEARSQLQAARAKEDTRRVQVLERQFGDLASTVAALKSDKPIDSPEHPIHGYREWIIESLTNGEMSFQFVEKHGKELYATWAGKQQGGLQNLVQKPARNLRFQILQSLSDAARQGAVTSVSQPQTSSAPGVNPSMVRNGIDGAKYLADGAYRASILQRADDMAMGGDLSLMRSLEALERNKTW